MHRVGVSALIVEDGRILLVRRSSGQPYAGRWSLPGGSVEPDERLEAALKREVVEETGLRVRPSRLVAAVEVAPDIVVLCYEAVVSSGRLRAGDDAADARWFTTDALPSRLTPGLRRLVASSASRTGSPSGRTRRGAQAR